MIRRFIQTHWPPLLLLTLGVAACITNTTPGTFLSGWDTLHPEFDIPLNLSRAFFGAFQPQAGLGAVAAHSHIADLPHILIIALFSLVFPLWAVRYLFIFLCFLLGPLGMYRLLSHLLPRRISFIGALFYMLNIGTVQMFYVPFEMFTVQYAVLPWLFFFATDYIFTKHTRSFWGFCVAVILAAPMAYAATLWYVTFFAFGLYITTLGILHFGEQKDKILYTSFLLIGIFLVLNLYWILPNLYFIFLYGKTVTLALGNQLFSPEAFLYNKSFGTIPDIALLRIFYFGWSIYANHTFVKLMQTWISYLDNPALLFLSCGLFSLASLGIIMSMLKKKIVFISFLPPLFLSLIFLVNANLPFHLYNLFSVIPLFQEAFRFPEDKILGVFIFLYTLFLSFGIYSLSLLLKPKLHTTYCILMTASIIILSFPIFTGQLIQPAMRIHIPQAYFRLFNYMQQQPQGRIATLPVNSLWGWEYYQWPKQAQSFQGSGFLWFGIPQPIMDRNYDRWNSSNEDYYQQLSYAVYSKNTSLLNTVLQEYDISYLLLDTSINAPGYKKQSLFYDQLTKMLEHDTLVKKKTTFGNTITLFTTKYLPKISMVGYQDSLPEVSSLAGATYQDSIYRTLGDYRQTTSSKGIYFPFASLTTNLGALKNQITFLSQEGITLSTSGISQDLTFPSFLTTEAQIPAVLSLQENSSTVTVLLTPITPTATARRPIRRTFSFSKTTVPLTLGINDTKAITIIPSKATKTYTLGTVWLSTKHNTISLFDLDQSISIPLALSQKSLSLGPCEQQPGTFGIQTLTGNTLSIDGMQTRLCAMIPVPQTTTLSNGKTILLTASYRLSTLAPTTLCFAEKDTADCTDTSLERIGVETPELASLISPSSQTPRGLKMIVDTTKAQTLLTASVTNLTLKATVPFASTTISRRDLEQVLTTAIQHDPSLTLENLQSTDFTSFTGNDCPYNPFILQQNDKRVLKRYMDNVEYVSHTGAFCDHVGFSNLTPQQAYLLDIKARNISGLPLTICVSTPDTDRCNLYTKLPSTKDFADTFLLIPPYPETHIDVNIDNLGIAPTTSINDIAGISLTPFPASWLTQMHTNSPDTHAGIFHTLAYTSFFNDSVITTTAPTEDTTLRFSTSYDPGFVLYALPAWVPTPFAITVPFLFGTPTGQHVRVNSWANGWTISPTANTKLVIIFLPQYLEYLGILIGVIMLLIAIFYKSYSRTR